jgi:hypothetical protein
MMHLTGFQSLTKNFRKKLLKNLTSVCPSPYVCPVIIHKPSTPTHTMTFAQQLQQANDATIVATHRNACLIASEDVPQGDGDQAVRVATALKVIEQCEHLIRERIREQGSDGSMADAVMVEARRQCE